MKKLLLTLLLGLFCMNMVNAQVSWTEPTDDNEPDTEASDPVSGHIYKVRNVESGFYLAGGAVWFSWGTTACLAEEGDEGIITFTLTEEFDEEGNSKGWTFKGYDSPWPDNYLFVSGNNGQGSFGADPKEVGFAMHVDNATDIHRYFELLKQESGAYRVRVAAADDTYGQAAVEDWENKFWGWDSTDEEHPNNLHASLVPSETIGSEFEFIDQMNSLYLLKKKLYDLAVSIEEEGLEVNYEVYTPYFEGNDEAAIKNAISELEALILQAHVAQVFNGVGGDGVNPPSQTNPADVTAIISNPEFEGCTNGNFPGWTIYAPNGGNTWVNGTTFVEYWNPTAETGKFDYYQEIEGLPAGKYTLVARMWNSTNGEPGVTFKPTSGVYGTTSLGTGYALVDIDCDNGNLQEYTSTPIFLEEGDVLRLGVKNLETMAARWFGVDYIHMYYYGEVQENPYKLALEDRIAFLEEQYYLDEVKAANDVKEAYAAALEAAHEAADTQEESDEFYQAATEALNEAASALSKSIADYANMYTQLNQLSDKLDKLAQTWDDLVNGEDGLANLYDDLNNQYEEGTLTPEAIAEALAEVNNQIATYISENCQAGDDVTVLLNNPGFDKDQSGWEITNYEGTGNVSASNHRWGGQNIILPAGFIKEGGEEVMEDETLVSGCNEIWRGAFKYQQTIKNMPAGLYTLSVKGFQRNEDNQADTSVPATAAELFAITGETVQTQKFANIFGDCSDIMLYNGGSAGDYGVAYGGGVGQEADLNTAAPANGLYYPNGMCGASAHFAAGYYKQEFNFVLTEATDVIIGARCQANNYWTLFDDFQLVYQGQSVDAYIPVIEKLIDQADELYNKGLLTAEDDEKLEAAKQLGEDAMRGTSTDDCVAAIEALRESIAYAEETLILTSELERKYRMTSEYRLADPNIAGTDTQIDELVGQLSEIFDSGNEVIESRAQLEEYSVNLLKFYTAYVLSGVAEGASEDNPVDVTAVIYNPTNYDYDATIGLNGWTVTGNAAFLGIVDNTASAEFFNQTFDLRQTIYGLVPGFYQLGVQGYYRQGEYADVIAALNGGEPLGSNVKLFAGNAETHLLPITEDLAAYNEFGLTGASVTVNGEAQYIANSMAEANSAFENGLYANVLQFEVAEGQESVEIGLSKDVAVTNDWTMFANWTLLYLGTTAPTEDPTTAIAGVEATAPAKAVIYNLAGQRVAKAVKGVYVINGKKVVIR